MWSLCGATLAWTAYLYKLEQMHGVPFIKPFVSGRELAGSEVSVLRAVGEPPLMWCPFVAGDLSPAPWLVSSSALDILLAQEVGRSHSLQSWWMLNVCRGSLARQRRWVRGPLATTSECRHSLGCSHLMLATRETDRVKVKNGGEQLGKGSEMKKYSCAKGCTQTGEIKCQSMQCNQLIAEHVHRREVSSPLFLFQQGSGMISLPCWAVALI